MPKYIVVWEGEFDAFDEEQAATDAANFLRYRALEFRIKADRGKTVLVRVERGEAKRFP